MDNQQRRIEEKLMWLGGIFDGEGSVTATAGHTKTGHGHLYKHRRYIPLISIVNTDQKIINQVLSIMDEAKIPYWVTTRKSEKNPHWKMKWEIMINGMKRCKQTIGILRPYVFGEKAEKMDVLEKWINRRLSTEQKKEYDEEDYRLLNLVRCSSITLRDYTPNPVS